MIGNGHTGSSGQAWKVGALARATGLTVRTLHYYDEIGLLPPSARLAGGHRLYDAADVARLYRIIRLRQLGFPLDQVDAVLAEPEWQLAPGGGNVRSMITHSIPARAPGTGVRPAMRRLGTRLAVIVASPAGAIVLGLASAGGALALAVSPATGHQVDFEAYRMGAAHLWLHLYDVQLEPFHLHFTYPPFAALLFWPLAQLPVHVGQVAWAVINLVALVALRPLSVRAARPDWALRRIWAIAVIAVFPVLEVEHCGRREPADGASC